MSFQDPPRRQRPPRYPALAQYENSYQYEDTYRASQDYASGQGEQPYGGASRQRAPWDDPRQRAPWDNNPQQSAPWDNQWQQPTQPAQSALPRRAAGPFFSDQPTGTMPRNGVLARDGERGSGRLRDGLPSDLQPRDMQSGDGQRPSKGLLAGGLTGFLSAAVAIGVANLVAAFVRPQASPIIAVGEKFIDLTPPALKNFAIQKFGENDKNMLLLGMYVGIALIAIGIGMMAWRRVAIGVAGIGLFGLFGAYIAITRPESHITDVIPSLVGGILGIAVLVWLVRLGAPSGRRRRSSGVAGSRVGLLGGHA